MPVDCLILSDDHCVQMIGYQASHEQFSPSELLRLVALAEEAGFSFINSSDHFHPWGERQGQSGFSFAWLGAAMQVTELPYGLVCSPGQRYHPAIVAQAAATLAEMFPSRFWMALGSGEAVNECITGDNWPLKQERNERLLECVDIIRRLFNGETVSHHGRVVVEAARLYTLPAVQPALLCAAITPETAAWAGKWADGLITVDQPHEQLQKVVSAYRDNGGAGKPVYLKVQLSYAADYETALNGARDQWSSNVFPSSVLADLRHVDQFDAIGKTVSDSYLKRMVRISSDLQEHIEWLKQDMRLGFDRIILHNVNRDQELFIRDFGEEVLPEFQRNAGKAA